MKFKVIGLFAILFAFLLFVGAIWAETPVRIEYYFLGPTPGCNTCPRDPDEQRVTQDVIQPIEITYGEQVLIERVDLQTTEGRQKWLDLRSTYGGLDLPRPTIVVYRTAFVNTTLVKQDTIADPITKEWLSGTIDQYLGKVDTNPFKPVVNSLQQLFSSGAGLAFSMGFINGFSPCLLAMLAFILTYSTGTSKGLKSGTGRAFIFGLGLVTAVIITGTAFLLLQVPFGSIMTYIESFTWIAAILMILVGLNLMDVLKLPISNKLFTHFTAGRVPASSLGLFSFGIVFFFLKAPCAFPLFLLLLANIMVAASFASFGLFVAFSLGLLVPFLAVGIIGGGAPELARQILQKHRFKIRAFSGLILIAYSVLLLLPLLPIQGIPTLSNLTNPALMAWLPATLLIVAAVTLAFLVYRRLVEKRRKSTVSANTNLHTS